MGGSRGGARRPRRHKRLRALARTGLRGHKEVAGPACLQLAFHFVHDKSLAHAAGPVHTHHRREARRLDGGVGGGGGRAACPHGGADPADLQELAAGPALLWVERGPAQRLLLLLFECRRVGRLVTRCRQFLLRRLVSNRVRRVRVRRCLELVLTCRPG